MTVQEKVEMAEAAQWLSQGATKRLCYDCDEFDEDTLKCPKRLGKTGKPTYVYTPTKAQDCHKFREKKK
jgi:hypothetical protein